MNHGIRLDKARHAAESGHRTSQCVARILTDSQVNYGLLILTAKPIQCEKNAFGIKDSLCMLCM